MQRFEITVGGAPEGDFGSQELADMAATAARHKPENKDKQVIVRPKEHSDDTAANPAPAVTTSTIPKGAGRVATSAVVPAGTSSSSRPGAGSGGEHR